MKKRQKLIPDIKKEVRDFCLSEEGRISKKTLTKLGLTFVVLGATVTPAVACWHGHSYSHTNAFNSCTPGYHESYQPHVNHSAHTSHGSHGQW